MNRKLTKALTLLGLTIGFVIWSVWPVQAGSSIKLNSMDRMSENIDLSTYADDGAWTTDVSNHMLTGGIYQSSPQTITDGRTGPFQVDSSGNIITSSGAAALVDLAAIEALLITIDSDTNDIKAATEGAEDELDGTTTDGPLDIIRAVDEGRAIAASGQHLDNAGAGTAASTDYTVTVVESALYRVHAVNGIIYLGVADATSDANVIWFVSAGQTIHITIVSGTTLHYATDSAGVEGRLARIK
tara:strand:+ start:3131 stop:3859 length:729 start_codon:yes stop_codon:yes gene_type:complete